MRQRHCRECESGGHPCDVFVRRVVKVPRLSDLREATGRDAYEASVIGAINRLIRTGELPYGDTCAVSGLPTTDVCRVAIVCERTWTRERGKTPFLLQALTWV